jgi:hypothetical protein
MGTSRRTRARAAGARHIASLLVAACLVAVLVPCAARADVPPPPPEPTPTSAPAAKEPKPSKPAADARGCPIPPLGPTKDGKPVPDPQAGASPAPGYPKAGTAGNCRPVAPNLKAPQPLPSANPPGTGPAWWDIPGQVEQAINTWIGDLARAALTPIMGLFTVALLTEPTLTTGRIAGLWQANAVLADSFYVLYVLFGGLLVLGYGTVQTRWTAGQILPRLVLGMIASNLSLPVIGWIVEFTGALSGALWSQPLDPAGIGDQVVQVVIDAILMPDGLTQIVMALFALVVCVLALAVLVTCAARIAALMLLTVLAPLMLATHALPGVDGCARLWWRAMGAVVGTQILQTLTFMLMLQVFCDKNAAVLVFPTTGGVTDFIVGTALLIVMLKIPGWMNRVALGHSPRTFIGQVLRTAAIAAVGYRVGVPGAYSSRMLASRLVGNRMRGGGGGGGAGPGGPVPLRPPGPRSPGPTAGTWYRRMPPNPASGALVRAVARSNGGDLVAAARQVHGVATANLPPAAQTSTAVPAGASQTPSSRLEPIGGRGFGSSRGSHASGQLALWPVPRGQTVPQPWPIEQSNPPAPSPASPVPGQLQLPGFARTPPPHSPAPTTWRNVPVFTVPRERRVPGPPLPEPAPAVAVRAQDVPGQQPLITVRAAKAQNRPQPRRPRRANLAVVFLEPRYPSDGEA